MSRIDSCGVSIHHPQLRANTLNEIAEAYKGRLCVDLDLDRQMFPFCNTSDMRRLVKESLEELYLPEGWLDDEGQVGLDVPLENIEALRQAMEEFRIGLKLSG